MSLSSNERAQLVIEFLQEHAEQITTKAAKYTMPREDIVQEVSLIIIEKGSQFDSSKGTFRQFVFGHLEKRMRRQLGAHTFAVSLDRDDIIGNETRATIENLAAPTDHGESTQFDSDRPGIAKALSIAHFVSGKSSSELARLLGVTPRRVRQILQKLRDQHATANQFGFYFGEEY